MSSWDVTTHVIVQTFGHFDIKNVHGRLISIPVPLSLSLLIGPFFDHLRDRLMAWKSSALAFAEATEVGNFLHSRLTDNGMFKMTSCRDNVLHLPMRINFFQLESFIWSSMVSLLWAVD